MESVPYVESVNDYLISHNEDIITKYATKCIQSAEVHILYYHQSVYKISTYTKIKYNCRGFKQLLSIEKELKQVKK